MNCLRCGDANPDGKRFCGDCGAPLPLRCGACGSDNPPGKRFCGDCGAPLTPDGPTSEPPVREEIAVAPPPAGERRQLTVMFCDLVGSTALSAQIDPEDMTLLIGAYQRVAAECVARFDGYVAKYMGDGVLAYFGYPQAHEDDAPLALHTGLAIIDAVAGLASQHGFTPRVRIGVATGPVVVGELVGEGTAQERSVVGETPNLAARLQEHANPDTLIVDVMTRRLAGGLFEYRNLGEMPLKGFARSIRAWQVIGTSTVQSRFEARHDKTLTPIVGRDEELEMLLRRWRRAKEGEGRVALISGEAGIGKSRLVAAFHQHLGDEVHVRLRYFCSPYHSDSALYPFISQLERATGFNREDTPDAKIDKLQKLLAGTPAADMALLLELLSIPAGPRYPALDLAPQRKKELTLRALLRQLDALARQQPVLMVFEDAHWSDPTSCDLVVEQIRALPVLLLITYRPEFQPTWLGQPHVTALVLNRLTRGDGAALAAHVAAGRQLPGELLQQIVDRTDGVPLFVEELTKTVLESGLLRHEDGRYILDGSLRSVAIPPTLQASLVARLDRLSAVKEVAQTAAVIGREFSHALIEAVSPLSKGALTHALDRLVEAGLVFRRGQPPDAAYTFKHALVQDAAYATLLRAPRQALHARVADALEAHFADLAERQPELMAHHLSAAGASKRAVEYWFRAGEHAAKRSANREAAAHFRAALRLVEQFAADGERLDWELRLTIALGPVLMMTTSSTAPEVKGVYAHASQLARQAGRSVELFRALWGSWLAAVAAADSRSTSALLEELFALAHQEANDEMTLQAHHAGWTTTFFSRGDFLAARRHIEAGVPLYRPETCAHHALLYGGHDPGVCGYGVGGMISALLGHLDRALREVSEGLNLGRALSHHGSLAQAYWFSSEVYYLRREAAALCGLTEEWVRLVGEHGSAVSLANATMFRGWGLIANGRREEGISILRDGLSLWRRSGAKSMMPFRLARIADGLLIAGETAEAAALLAEAATIAEETGDHWSDPEIDRLSGIAKLRLAEGAVELEAGEHYLRRALAGTRDSGMRLIELRAATSLARLYGERGRRTEARDVLSPIYGWFSEGLDTPDLKEAGALLAEL
jgi:class 3 adenylate cyclase/tetratricopeptide (TPR) repeat protein